MKLTEKAYSLLPIVESTQIWKPVRRVKKSVYEKRDQSPNSVENMD